MSALRDARKSPESFAKDTVILSLSRARRVSPQGEKRSGPFASRPDGPGHEDLPAPRRRSFVAVKRHGEVRRTAVLLTRCFDRLSMTVYEDAARHMTTGPGQ
jgi:hypothetical protein